MNKLIFSILMLVSSSIYADSYYIDNGNAKVEDISGRLSVEVNKPGKIIKYSGGFAKYKSIKIYGYGRLVVGTDAKGNTSIIIGKNQGTIVIDDE